jgi:hypothetical protein
VVWSKNGRFFVSAGLEFDYHLTAKAKYVDGSSAHIWKVKLAYTKSHDYSLGLEFALMKVPLRNVKNDPIVYLFALASRFYF